MESFHTIKLKTPAGDFHRIRIAKPMDIGALRAAIKSFYPRVGAIQYPDEDGDLITMDTESELEEALTHLEPNSMLRLQVTDAKVDPENDKQASNPPPGAAFKVPTSEGLPSGWEVKTDAKGRVYFANHNDCTTTWCHPITNERIGGPSSKAKEPAAAMATTNCPSLAEIEAMTKRVVAEALAGERRYNDEMIRKMIPEVLSGYGQFNDSNTTVNTSPDDIVIPVSMSVAQAQQMQERNGCVSINLPQLMSFDPANHHQQQQQQPQQQPQQQQQQAEEWEYETSMQAAHFGIICDTTQQNPIRGTRYHMINEDYDLCESSFRRLDRDEQAKFEVIKFPGDVPVPYSQSEMNKEFEATEEVPVPAAEEPVAELAVQTKVDPPPAVVVDTVDCGNGDGDSNGDGNGGGGEATDATPMFASSPDDVSPRDSSTVVVDMPLPPCRPMVEFDCDVTLPDGQSVGAGADLVKTWSVRNSGASTWPQGSKLILAEGLMASVSASFNVPCANPGDIVHVSANISTKNLAAGQQHIGVFRLVGVDDQPFVGDLLWCKIVVIKQPVWDDIRGAASNQSTASGSDFGTIDGDASEEEFIVVRNGVTIREQEQDITSCVAVKPGSAAAALPPNEQQQQQPHLLLPINNEMPDSTSFALDLVANCGQSQSQSQQQMEGRQPQQGLAPSMMVFRNDGPSAPAPQQQQEQQHQQQQQQQRTQLYPSNLNPFTNSNSDSAPSSDRTDSIPGIYGQVTSQVTHQQSGSQIPAVALRETAPVYYDNEMNQLISMGFAKRDVNYGLLQQHNGDVADVINKIISMQESGSY